tara:strand:+ start:1435 stop:1794 length:360 start_codon:yes stop_codon:yes gene_type:complete
MSTDDMDRKLEVASLLGGRYYLILNNNDSDSFTMAAYDTNKPSDSEPEIPAGMVILSGIIELMENHFDTIWDAGVARTKFMAAIDNIQIELDDDEVDEAVEKVLSRTGNIIKVDFGKEQ